MIPSPYREQLSAHVESVLESSHLTAPERADVAEELYGHLAERWQRLVAAGTPPKEAADQAIREFGSAHRIGGDLTRSYRGRIWASTIGVLLPATWPETKRPRTVWWLGASLRAYAVLGVASIFDLTTSASPLRAAVLLVVGVAWVTVQWIASGALERGQRWALFVAVAVNAVAAVTGVREMAANPGLISVTGLISAAILLAAARDRRRLGEWVEHSALPVRHRLGIGAVACLGMTMPFLAPHLPDPTQITPADVELIARADCDALVPWREEPVPGEGVDVLAPAIVVTADVRMERTALLPSGVDGLFASIEGDVIGIHWVAEDWAMVDRRLYDPETGQKVPGLGVLPPNVLEPPGAAWWYATVARDELEPGRTVRFEVTFADAYGGPRTAPLPSEPVRVTYHHAHSFTLESWAGCQG